MVQTVKTIYRNDFRRDIYLFEYPATIWGNQKVFISWIICVCIKILKAWEYIHYEMEHLDHEELRIISLDTKNYVIGEDLLYRGTINTSTLRVAEIFKKPLLLNAASFVMVHNHPSGDPTPSAADIVATRKVIETGITMDLPLLDHVIIGAGKFTSMRNYLP